MNSIVSVDNDQEACFRRGFQQGAQAALLAMNCNYTGQRLNDWINYCLANWRTAGPRVRQEPPGPNGDPWPFMYPDEPEPYRRQR